MTDLILFPLPQMPARRGDCPALAKEFVEFWWGSPRATAQIEDLTLDGAVDLWVAEAMRVGKILPEQLWEMMDALKAAWTAKEAQFEATHDAIVAAWTPKEEE